LTSHPNVDFKPRAVVERIDFNGRNFQVTVSQLASASEMRTSGAATMEAENPPGAAHEYSSGSPNVEAAPQLEIVSCDNVVAHTGFRPDRALWSELQVHEHFATGGPFELAQAILSQNKRSGVGLSTGYAEKNAEESINAASHAAEKSANGVIGADANDSNADTSASLADSAVLQPGDAPIVDRFRAVVGDPQLLSHPEPNFFIIGIKSYGRDAGFLMQNGFRQVRDAYQLISGDAALDCYDGALDEERQGRDAPAAQA